ncbi:MAG: hypothetical protein NTX40_00975 [Planctomycetota bacterium]|nr:hypothetical protein [Planctomycetota bacterium]
MQSNINHSARWRTWLKGAGIILSLLFSLFALWQSGEIRYAENLPAMVVRSLATERDPDRLRLTNYGKGPAIARGFGVYFGKKFFWAEWRTDHNYFVPPGEKAAIDIPGWWLSEPTKQYAKNLGVAVNEEYTVADLTKDRPKEFPTQVTIKAYFEYSDVFGQGLYRQYFFYYPFAQNPEEKICPSKFQCLRKPGPCSWIIHKLLGPEEHAPMDRGKGDMLLFPRIRGTEG